jgi:Mlc titration factor MtfA (ptsG expression regulator)
MENNLFLVLAIAGLFFLYTLYIFSKIFRGIVAIVQEQMNAKYLLKKLHPKYKVFLNEHLNFYKQLNYKDKVLFERRVQHFIDTKYFIPRGGLKEVSNEMKALIAGAAIQITFGHPNVYLRHFKKILIYPDSYYSTITKKYHFGEVNPKGIIVLSVKNLMHGFSDPNDGINLALHEMAHAIKLQSLVKNSRYGFLNLELLYQIKYEGKLELEKLKHGQIPFFRKYGLTNFNEFFAVIVENFFERPTELEQYNPKLFRLISQVLNIDPIHGKIISRK